MTSYVSPRSTGEPEENNAPRGAGDGQIIEPSHTSIPASETTPRQTSGSKRKRGATSDENRNEDASDDDERGHDANANTNGSRSSSSRMAISGLRPSRQQGGGPVVVEDNTQRQMQVVSENFPKRRKAEATGYAMKPSTLDKLIVGIWEQLHSGANMDPAEVLGQFGGPPLPLLQDTAATGPEARGDGDGGRGRGDGGSGFALSALAPGNALLSSPSPSSGQQQFSDTTIFCRKVTQASRTCRSIEVIVQARWVEHFDAYVEHLKRTSAGDAAPRTKATAATTSSTRHRKAALVEAAAGFGWTEKELRNKMAIWRGYREIKDAGGWAALVFAGMGIYRFCKYRIGFDADSMQRLRHLRPALEVAADTMSPGWRRLLAVVGEPADRVYAGHPHDWVICLDGSPPLSLRQTYLQWDPNFEYKHIEESVVDQAAWGCEDPRWAPSSSSSSSSSPSSSSLDAAALTRTRVSSQFVCEVCGSQQSDNAKVNGCACFPSLFGCVAPAPPSPVQVFRTPDGRNNGLMALCAFERGAAVGEFVGVVTRGLRDVDVMENTAAANGNGASGGGGGGVVSYQIWQGSQGNFTRFVNHSCNANAQYQRFTWLDTQRIVLVSKGIRAGSEITVDYSDKYWKGLDKKCLCGEKSCRYRRRSANAALQRK